MSALHCVGKIISPASLLAFAQLTLGLVCIFLSKTVEILLMSDQIPISFLSFCTSQIGQSGTKGPFFPSEMALQEVSNSNPTMGRV